MKRKVLRVAGWREWISLPDLAVEGIKAKLDTGALYSTLHASKIREYTREDGATWIHFRVHPQQGSRDATVAAEAPLVAWKRIRSSNGMTENRPMVRTTLALGGARWKIDLTLARRERMTYRVLLGRKALRKHLVVDASGSYLITGPPQEVNRESRNPV